MNTGNGQTETQQQIKTSEEEVKPTSEVESKQIVVETPTVFPIKISEFSQQKTRNYSAAGIANWIAAGGALINAVLVFISIMVWRETVKASKISSESFKLSEKAFQETVASNESSDSVAQETLEQYKSYANSAQDASKAAENSNRLAQKNFEFIQDNAYRNYQLATKSADSNNAVNRSLIDNQIQSLNTQIASFIESNKKFITENSPIIELSEPELLNYQVGKPLSFTCKILNIGRYPVKLGHTKSFCDITDKVSSISLHNIKNHRPEVALRHVAKENPVTLSFVSHDTVSLADYRDLLTGKLDIHALATIQFRNIVTEKQMQYDCHIKVSLAPVLRVVYLRADYTDNILGQ